MINFYVCQRRRIYLISFNTIDFCILGIPAYFFCAFCGFVITTCTYIVLMSSKKYDISHSVRTLFISLVGMALGAKLFGYLSGIYRAIGLGNPITLDSLLDTGIVYYGGLLGLIATYSLCLRASQCSLDAHSLDVLAVCFPLFHAIARVGCFLSGCCYGKIYKGTLAVNYTTIIEGNAVQNLRIPVQLIESSFELVLFFYLLTLLHTKEWQAKKLLLRYLALYSVGRFFIEFLRGDIRRGIIGGISFSQCISILIGAILISYCLTLRKRFKNIKGGA